MIANISHLISSKLLSCGLLGLALLLTGCASRIPETCRIASSNGAIVSEGLGANIDAALLEELKEGVFSGAVLVIKEDKTLLKRGYGCANQDRAIPNTPNIISNVASVAKTFTATAVLLLDERGQLSLSDKISDYYPDAPSDVGAITLEQLLLHRAGLENYIGRSTFISRTCTQAEQKILNRSLKFKPDDDYSYSNSGYILLAAIVERASGISFPGFIKQEFLIPLGLNDTRHHGDTDIEVNRLAGGYGGFWGGLYAGWKAGDTTHSKKLTWSAIGRAGMVSTVGDMLRWFQALSSSDKFSPKLREQIFATTRSRRSLGHWQTITIRGAKTVQASGANTYGYVSKIMYLPETGITVVFVFNAYSGKYGVRTAHSVSHDVILPEIIKFEEQ
jgi:CubicO group peptidase (beta-lactamase class C family)